MTNEGIESSDRWSNDPGPVSEDELEVSDDDFEIWQMSDVKPDQFVGSVPDLVEG